MGRSAAAETLLLSKRERQHRLPPRSGRLAELCQPAQKRTVVVEAQLVWYFTLEFDRTSRESGCCCHDAHRRALLLRNSVQAAHYLHTHWSTPGVSLAFDDVQ